MSVNTPTKDTTLGRFQVHSQQDQDTLQVVDEKGLLAFAIDKSGNFSGYAANPPVITFPGAPTGVGAPNQIAVNSATGDTYSFSNGAWVKIGPNAGGTTLVSPVVAPNPLALDVSVNFKGPSPYVDITRYGARAVNSGAIPNGLATIVSGTNSV